MVIERTYPKLSQIVLAKFELGRVKQINPASDHGITDKTFIIYDMSHCIKSLCFRNLNCELSGGTMFVYITMCIYTSGRERSGVNQSLGRTRGGVNQGGGLEVWTPASSLESLDRDNTMHRGTKRV